MELKEINEMLKDKSLTIKMRKYLEEKKEILLNNQTITK